MGVTCAVDGCFSTRSGNVKRKFYSFPLDEIRCRQWILAAGRPDLQSYDIQTLHKNKRICDHHFVASDKLNSKLSRNAVPSINLPQFTTDNSNHMNKYTQTTELPSTSKTDIIPTQTDNKLSENSPRKRKLQQQLEYKCKEIKKLENQVSRNTTFGFSSLFQKIIYIQKKFKERYKGNRYDHEFKMFAMNIYFASPMAYRILAKTLFLPSERTLRRTKIDIDTNLSDNVIRCLQAKVKYLSRSEKYCVLCADEMSLKRHLHYQINKDKIIGFHEINNVQNREPATQAFVVIARGLFSNWKQPLAYCFLSQSKNYPELNAWLDGIIIQVLNIGFNVVAFVSDQGSNFINIAKGKDVSTERTYFHVNGKKIYYIFDAPHLLKSLRNNLMKYDFIYLDTNGKEETASWEDVENIFDFEKDKSYQLTFKLTESHIRPNSFEKMRVQYAAQIFSRTVATALHYYVDCGKMKEKVLGTAKLMQLINDMFDILNSSTCNDAYKYKRSFSQQDYQMEMLQNVLSFLKDVRIIHKSNGKNVKNGVKCLKGLEITIQSVISLSTDLKHQNFAFIFTRRLDQDVLEDFFGAIRQQGGNCREPTPVQFANAFKKLFLTNIMRHSEHAICIEDLDKLLVINDDISCTKLDKLKESENINILTVGTIDYRFDPPEENAFTYVCGYLLKKCKQIHNNCTQMVEYVNYKGEVNSTNSFINMRAYNNTENFGSLVNPQENLKDFVRNMDKIVRTIFKERNVSIPLRVGNEILRRIDLISFSDVPCMCFPIEYLKKLFIRFRIFNIIKHNNRNFRDKTFRKKFFSVSHL